MRILLAIAAIAVSSPALASPRCTNEPVSKWLPQEEVKKKAVEVHGYSVRVFKVTIGNCYEVYGRDKAGKRIEVYFNPVTAEIVKANVQ